MCEGFEIHGKQITYHDRLPVLKPDNKGLNQLADKTKDQWVAMK